MTVFTPSVFMFSEFSDVNLKFGIKQSKIGEKFAEEWLPKLKFPDLLQTDDPSFSKNEQI